MFCSKIFATGPSKLGSVMCQIENQTESRKNQGDHILQVHFRQKNRTQPKTLWGDTKSLSSSEISRNYFRLPTHFQKHFEDILDRCNTRYHRLRLPANKKWGPSPSTLIQIYKQCVRPTFEHGSLSTITASDYIISKIQRLQSKFIRLALRLLNPGGDSLTFMTWVIISSHFLRPPNMLTKFSKNMLNKFSETPKNYVDQFFKKIDFIDNSVLNTFLSRDPNSFTNLLSLRKIKKVNSMNMCNHIIICSFKVSD